ncbi:microtubule associated protein [Diaporthe helianthi]|uniref:Microtubule associated protein n=1 Tax=Diaporthe helianthi TaxID=158607 RepID=A0A2P5HUW7_DIAHE|nr:microtubule associated protein [Diaporthe helianthi]
MDTSDSTIDLAARRPLPESSSTPTLEIDSPDHHNPDISRPSTAYRVSGTNSHPDDDHHGDRDHGDGNGQSRDTNEPTPTRPTSSAPRTVLKADEIPNLRPPSGLRHQSETQHAGSAGDYSFAEGHSAVPESELNDSYMAHVKRQLQDIESSFTTPISPLPTVNSLGQDDTFVFDSPSKLPKPAAPAHAPAATPASSQPPAPDQKTEDEPSLPHIPPPTESNHKSPEPKREPASDQLHVPEGTSALEAFSSSPTGATTARTISRAMSRISNAHSSSTPADDNQQLLEEDDSFVQHDSLLMDDSFLRQADTSRTSGASGTSALHSQRRPDFDIPKISVDAGSAPGHGLKSGKRPKYLRSRMASHHSSSSSFNDDIESDVTAGTAGGLGADYALQSGGAIPALGNSRNSSMSNIVTRQISMGSMVSDFREDSTGRIGVEPLEPLDEYEGMSSDNPNDDRLKTPKAPRQPLTEPTDTAIARHVRSVQVPESLAREYRSKSGFVTPRRKLSEVNLGASVSTTRTGKNLTLKEQSSTIERLSKENFDLKLKVMFLSDRLDKLSEEGIKEMISENVELKTSVAVMQRDNKVLRRRVKELEKKLKDEDERPDTAKSGGSSGPVPDDYDPHANEEELIYLRERVDEFITEIERLKQESMSKEAEKRRMAEVVKNLQSVHENRVGESLGQHDDELDAWKELYNQESARREQSDEENKRMGEENRTLRDEVFRLKQDLANSTNNLGGRPSSHASQPSGMSHTTNIYNITKKSRPQSPSRPQTRMSEADTMNGAMSVSVSLVEELRRESEQLRHENTELRREVGAQTSMLTSRNREKERLYQEIEDLKMAARRGGPTPSTIDSLLDRSASRAGAHDRPQSRGSGMTRTATLDEDPEREELENKLAEFRDKLNEAKMQNQDLQQELGNYMQEYEAELEGRRQAETAAQQLQEELEATQNDLLTLQQERDELLQENSGLDHEFNALREEAQDEIDHLESENEQREQEIARLSQELAERNENQEALQEEMRRLSEDMIRFEDTQETQLQRIQELETELTEANKELEDLEAKLLEANDKAQRLGIQLESTQSEISFLREEQEGDKLRIGDLVGQLANTELALREEKERVKELENQLQSERHQREVVANQEKADVQQVVNNLNRELSTSKDEARKLRKSLSRQETETTEWKARLGELENNLREALGDLNGTRSSFLRDITKLQNDLDTTCRELDATRASLNEKDHLIKQRDELLESHALESRRLGDTLAKEQQAHRNTKHQFETYQKTQQHVHGTMSSAELRIKELEAAKSQDKQRLTKLETSLKEQLNERNSLLLVLWTRLSSLCGTDWAHDNSLISGRALPSLESVATMLPGFSKNLLAAVKTIESIVSKFQDRVKSVERELWREYQHLEESLDKRIKKLDKIESIVRNGVATGTIGIAGQMSQALLEEQKQRLAKLEDAYRQLKVENATLRTANEVRHAMLDPRAERDMDDDGSPSPSIPTGPTGRARSGERGSGRSERSRQSSRHVSGGAPTTSSGSSMHRATSRASTMTRETMTRETMTRERSNEMTAAQDLINEYSPRHSSLSNHSNHNNNNNNTNHNTRDTTSAAGSRGPLSPGAPFDAEVKWMHRLKDMENKLKAEREGRRLDRNEASRKIISLEEVALQAQAREAKIERRRRMEAALSLQGSGDKSGRRSPGAGGL